MDRYAARLRLEEVERETTRVAPSPVLRDVYLLESIFSQLPLDTLRILCLVSRVFHDAALREMMQDVSCHSVRAVSQFEALLAKNPCIGRRVKGFHITKASLPLALSTLPDLTPNLSTLTLTASSSLLPADLITLLPRWSRLRKLVILGQDSRSRRRRLSERIAESDIASALLALAEDGRIRLTELEIMNTPLCEETIELVLKAWGEGLNCLTIEGCGVSHGIVSGIVGRYCPALSHCRLDALTPYIRATPPPPGAPALPPPLPITIDLPSNLTSIHFSSLPTRLSPDAFTIFSDSSRSSLRTVSFSHSPITPLHLSHFTRIVRLKIVACPHITFIPVFPLPGAGAGCKELRHLSLLGCRGLTLGNLWELAMLGREEMGSSERAERKKLGLGDRGLKKLTIDGADGREYAYLARGLFFSPFPLPLPTPSTAFPDESPLPSWLAPPPYLIPHLLTNVLDPALPSNALLQTLIMALDLEEVAFFGTIPAHATTPASASSAATPTTSSYWLHSLLPNTPPSHFYNFLGLGTVLSSLLTTLNLLPTTSTSSEAQPSDWPPVPFQQSVGKDGKPNLKRGRIGWPKVGSGSGRDVGRRLSDEEVKWLLKASEGTGNLQRVSV